MVDKLSRNETETPTPPVTEDEGGVRFWVKVVPRASRNRVVGPHDGAFKISLTAPPVDGAANEALLAFLAKALHVSRAQVEIEQGQSSRLKRIRVRSIGSAAVREGLR